MEFNPVKNKYYKWYTTIIQKAQNRSLTDVYIEKHHVIPRSLGGSNKKCNIVSLTAREHFLCHVLLTKFVTGESSRLMHYALGKFIQSNQYQQRIFNSRQYQQIRESISLARTGTKFSDETKQKMSIAAKGRVPWNKGLTGVIHHSPESNQKRSKTQKGRTLSKDVKAKISASKKGKPSGMIGKKHSEETLQKMREARLRYYAKNI